MPRINYDKCHEGLLNELVRSEKSTGPFETKAKCLTYAASFGASFGAEKGRKPLQGTKMDLRYDAFSSRDFEDFLGSLAVFATKDVKFLENNEETATDRVRIFEEFANCGLERLSKELKGEANKTDGIALLISKSYSEQVEEDGIDWNQIENL
jgi:dnd system-associated protein 4